MLDRLGGRDAWAGLRNTINGSQQNLTGEPYAFGSWDNEVASLSGPWDFVKDGIHHPRWVSSSDGTWRAADQALDVNVPLHDSTFARPKAD